MAAKEAEHAKIDLEARIAAATDVPALLETLRETKVEVGTAACRDAWLRLVSTGSVSADHDVVETTGREFAHGWLPSSVGPKRGVWSSPIPIREIWSSADGRVWLDADGQAYETNGDVHLSLARESSRTRVFVLLKGETAILRKVSGDYSIRYIEVTNGIGITRNDDEYRRTLIRVLENHAPR